jgi:hypothetical protein
MRELACQKLDELNCCLSVHAMDEPSEGGASHEYRITVTCEYQTPLGSAVHPSVDVKFQQGPIREVGVNGISEASLMAILMDRLQGFQGGPYKCSNNEHALFHLRQAMMHLNARTRERQARGVEGTRAV